jgi:hypothetical protein
MVTQRADGGLTFPITPRCASVDHLLAERELESAIAPALAKAFSRAAAELPPALARGTRVLQPAELVKGDLSEQQKGALARIRRAIETAGPRIANLSELTEFLLIYEKSPDAIKAKMIADLIGLGDIESNLVRMRKDANESKSNKSWNDVTYEQMKKYGYENSEVDAMREREAKELEPSSRRSQR